MAVLATAAMVLVRFALSELPNSSAMYLPFVFAVIAAAWHGGLAPGLLATALSAVAASFFFTTPVNALGVESGNDWARLVFFIGVGVTASLLFEAMHAARRRAEDKQRQLEQEIAERRRVEAALRRSEARLRLLSETAVHLLTIHDPHSMVHGLFEQIKGHFKLDVCLNFLVNEKGDALYLESCAGVPREMRQSLERLEFGQAICGAVALERRPIVVCDVQGSDDPRARLVKELGLTAYVCYPLLADRRLLGTISLGSRARDTFDKEELEFFQTVSHCLTVAYERLRLILRLREADQRKDEFLATLAHELRNPLAPIRNALQMMRLAGGHAETEAQARNILERQVRQVVRLVDDLMDVSRIGRSKLELRKEPVELTAILQSAIEIGRPLIEASGHLLVAPPASEPVLLEADSARLVQVFSNLLNNAAKYTERGGRIELLAERQGSDAVVTVKDTGIGIPADKLPNIFDMYMQVDRSVERSQGGLGIGLTLVRRLIELHGGSIEARSEGAGQGSEFIVRLPVLLHRPAELAPPSRDGHGQLPTAERRRILVVDDDADAVLSLSTILTLLGNEVYTAHDGVAAVETAESRRPDVALLDIGMPRLNGYDAARRIRSQPWGKSMILIAVTGWGQEEDRQRTREAGFDHHLVKPLDVDALENLLNSLRVQA